MYVHLFFSPSSYSHLSLQPCTNSIVQRVYYGFSILEEVVRKAFIRGLPMQMSHASFYDAGTIELVLPHKVAEACTGEK